MQEAQLFQCARINSDNITQYRNPKIGFPYMSHPFGGNLMNDTATGKHAGVNSVAHATQTHRDACDAVDRLQLLKSFVSFISCHSFSLPLAQYYVLPSAR